MEKLLFLFRRKPGTTRAEFYEYYVNVHNPLGLSLNPGIKRYTVNFVESDGTDVDSVTELWTPSANDMITGKTFPSPEHRAKSVADGQAFMGPADMFQVEEHIVLGDEIDAGVPAGEGPWAKLVSLHDRGEDPGEPPAGAVRVIDNRVVQTFHTGHGIGDDSEEHGHHTSDIALMRMIWAEDPRVLPAGGGPTMLRVLERREAVPDHDGSGGRRP